MLSALPHFLCPNTKENEGRTARWTAWQLSSHSVLLLRLHTSARHYSPNPLHLYAWGRGGEERFWVFGDGILWWEPCTTSETFPHFPLDSSWALSTWGAPWALGTLLVLEWPPCCALPSPPCPHQTLSPRWYQALYFWSWDRKEVEGTMA